MKLLSCFIPAMFFCIIAMSQDANTPQRKPKVIIGVASFYSSNLDGTETSTGERYRNLKMSAASNHFKLNTWVKITNLRNNKVIRVRINDHMHVRMAKKGRVVDLSRTAAKQLGFISRGLTRVKVEEILDPKDQRLL